LRQATLSASGQAARLNEIREMRTALPLRSDGSFDERNKQGRALNAEFRSLAHEHEQTQRIIDDLSGAAESRFREWVVVKSGLLASRAGLLALVGATVALAVRTPPVAHRISELVQQSTGLHPIFGLTAFYGVLALSSAVALLTFILCWAVARTVGMYRVS